MKKRNGSGECWSKQSPHIETKAARVFSYASAETEIREGSLPRTRLTGLFVALIEDVDTILRRGPITRPMSREGYLRERQQAYKEALVWAQEDVGVLTLSAICAYLRTQGINADEDRIRRAWKKIIERGGARASRYERSRNPVPALHVLGVSTTPSD